MRPENSVRRDIEVVNNYFRRITSDNPGPVVRDRRKMLICYHGTKQPNTVKILQDGFRVGTYFAAHLEDAIGFGGDYIFEVMFFERDVRKRQWQFITDKVVPPERIVRLTRYNPADVMFENRLLYARIGASNEDDDFYAAIQDHMRKKPDAYSREERIAFGMEQEVSQS